MPTPDRTALARLADQRGITLIESLIALGLLILGAAAIGDFMAAQIRHSTGNHLSTAAYAMAADEIERIRSLPFAEMIGSTRTAEENDVVFKMASSVREGVPEVNMKSIGVRVTWISPVGPQSVDLQTVYAQVTPE